MLDHNRTLTSLFLSRNEIGDAGAQALAKALRSNNHLEYLSLSGNEIGDAGAQALAAMLHQNRTLKDLCLYSNEIGDAGTQALSKAKEKTLDVPLEEGFNLRRLVLRVFMRRQLGRRGVPRKGCGWMGWDVHLARSNL
eukprot:NODE_20627_length_789_cov_6.936556.p2 GENE.NODE_20627_length_789_cov_6.936556~~NODE_20627_length_789_cov_6.936556.p2  ORF type:complete len:138 (-),score=24.77 NODE_20627_length_789_cov_6.936556:13-426(-)